MNGKERIKAAFEGKETDKVPYAEAGIDSAVVEKIIGHKTYLRNHIELTFAFWENRQDEVMQSWIEDHIELHKKLGIMDIVVLGWGTWEVPPETDDPPPKKIDDKTWEDKYGRIYSLSEETMQIACVKDPVQEQKRKPVLEDFLLPPPLPVRDERSWKVLDAVIKALGHEKYVAGPTGGQIGMHIPGGQPVDEAYMFLAEYPEIIEAAVKWQLQNQRMRDDVLIHPGIDAALWGCDYGHKMGTFISPAMFEDFYLEADKIRAKQMHDRGLKIIEHACGNNWTFLKYFLEIGYDCYQAIQASATMDIARLKKEYGNAITLWGGVTVEKLVSGTTEEVRADVRYAIENARQGGRFILGSSHSICNGTKYDNYMAMLDEYQKLA